MDSLRLVQRLVARSVLLSTVDLYRYTLPLTSPLGEGEQARNVRRGLLIRLQSDSGAVGWGEASPLPGFSRETLDDVVGAAGSLKDQLEGEELSIRGGDDAVLLSPPLSDEYPASLRFAVESAAVHLSAEEQERTVAGLLGGTRETISLNALIADPLEEGTKKASALREAGFEAVKIKVGRGPIDEEASCIRSVSEVLGDDVSLRLDANRAWSLEDALTFAESVRDVPVAYLEEPLEDPRKLPSLATQTSLPLALDETTREIGPAELDVFSFVAAVVLKPTLCGGIAAARRWAKQAERYDALPVLSASYESGVGLRMLGALASTLPATPVGLSTYGRLEADVLTPRLRMEGPSVAVEELFASSVAMKLSLLEPIGVTS